MSLEVEAWHHYWEQNQSANSFEFDYSITDGPYGVINRFWNGIFRQFTNNTSVVDLGAGNGALSHLYFQSKQEILCKGWINLDYANTKKLVDHPLVRHQQGNMHELPFADNSVDFFISMFGFEYASFEHSISQINRCISCSGRFAFIMHHPDAIISKQSQITIKAFSDVLASDLLSDLNRYSDLALLKRTLLSGLQTHLQNCAIDAQTDIKLVGQNIYFILQQCQNVEQASLQLNKLSQQLKWQVIRLQDQLNAANQVSSIKQELGKYNNIAFTLSPLTYNDDTLAWVLQGNNR